MVFLDYRMDPRRQRQRMTRRKVRPIIGIQWSSMRGSFGAVANETSRSIIWKKRCFSKESLTRVLRGRSVGDSVKTLTASFSLHMRLRVIVYWYSCYDLELCDRDFEIFETRSRLKNTTLRVYTYTNMCYTCGGREWKRYNSQNSCLTCHPSSVEIR